MDGCVDNKLGLVKAFGNALLPAGDLCALLAIYPYHFIVTHPLFTKNFVCTLKNFQFLPEAL